MNILDSLLSLTEYGDKINGIEKERDNLLESLYKFFEDEFGKFNLDIENEIVIIKLLDNKDITLSESNVLFLNSLGYPWSVVCNYAKDMNTGSGSYIYYNSVGIHIRVD